MLALITGATSGIGKSTAQLFAKNGYDVIITGRRKDRLDTLSADIQNKSKVKALALSFDVRNLEEVTAAIQSLTGKWTNIDVLVNNAGLAAGLSTLQDGLISDWEQMIDTNIKGLLYITKTVAQLMIKNGTGHIVNIGSIAGKEVYPNGNVYCATKHAVDALNRGMRLDLLPHGIRVTGIHPGMVETEFSVVRFHGDEDRAKKVYAGLKPLTPDDIADTIYWAVTRPAHVNITEVVLTPTAQGNATTSIRKN